MLKNPLKTVGWHSRERGEEYSSCFDVVAPVAEEGRRCAMRGCRGCGFEDGGVDGDGDADAELVFEFAVLFTSPRQLSDMSVYYESIAAKEKGGTNINDVDCSVLVFGARFAVPGYIWIAFGHEDVVIGHGM